MNRTTAAAIVAGAVTLGVAYASSADAHTPNEQSTCTGLTVTYTGYEGDPGNNRLTVTIDGVAHRPVLFGQGYAHTYAWDPTAAHEWHLDLDANRATGDPDKYDHANQGAQQPCPPPSTSSTPATTTPATSTTTAPAPVPSDSIPAPEPTSPATSSSSEAPSSFPSNEASDSDAPTGDLPAINEPADAGTPVIVDTGTCLVGDDQGNGTLYDGTPCSVAAPIDSAAVADAPAAPAEAPTTPAGSTLPATGNSTAPTIAALAVAILALGFALARVSNRRSS